MRGAVSLVVVVSVLAPYGTTQTRTVPINETTSVVYDTTLHAEPDFERLESLIDLFFELLPTTTRPEVIEIRLLHYRDFEIEYAKSQAGPNWHQWLHLYQTQGGTRLVGAFVRPDDIMNGKLIIFSHDPSGETLIHEMTHWSCFTYGPQIASAFHKSDTPLDCVRSTTFDILHSLQYRTWLRDQPWQ